MSLDEELRAALDHAAEARTPPPPDLAGLCAGGRARRRRRRGARLGLAAAVAVVGGVGVYGATWQDASSGSGVAGTRGSGSEAPRRLPTRDGADRAPVESGTTVRVLVGEDADGEPIEADLTVEGPHWVSGDYLVVSDGAGGSYAGFGAYQPEALSEGTGCGGSEEAAPVPRSPRALAARLAEAPRSTLLDAPTRTRAFGHDAVRLRLRIDVDCPDDQQFYRLAWTPLGDRGLTYHHPEDPDQDIVVELLVLDLGGTPVVVDFWHDIGAPAALADQAEAARDSIRFVLDE